MKKNIALVTGGLSGESVISYKSAATIDQYLNRQQYNVYVIDVNAGGWFYTDSQGNKTRVNKDDFSIWENDQKVQFDAVLIGLHGTPGEDGKLQGYFDMLKIPYTGCDATTSAITFNKRYTVAVAKMAGIDVANSLHLFAHTPVAATTVLEQLTLPLFVKPNNGGSSIGMSKVVTAAALPEAIEKAFKEDAQVLVEEMITGREFTVGVYQSEGRITVLPLTEVKAHADKAFFDFEAKYEGKSSEVTPAIVEEAIAEKVRNAARKVYQVFNCRGVIRIDFIYNEAAGRPFMLEINTIPGQSAASIVPQQVVAAGGNLTDFYSLLIEECFA